MNTCKRLLLFLILLVLILLGNHLFGWSDNLANGSLEILRAVLERNRGLAVLLYMGITIVGCVVLALPGIVFAVAAGVLFGPVWGTVACSLATTIGAVLAFLAGRYFLQDAVKPLVMKNPYVRRFLYEESDHNALFLLLVTRLLPIFPYNLQNFAYGITKVKLLSYTLYSFLFMIPGTAAYTLAAAGVVDTEKRVVYLLIAGGLFLTVLLVAIPLRKRVRTKTP